MSQPTEILTVLPKRYTQVECLSWEMYSTEVFQISEYFRFRDICIGFSN